ncbi:hypothetical protein BRC68_04365 [Halobacteriales archaeon QH_6_64_20]|nr:MAG: hypothetical protein BRC68_04365 [Halobacteriales archaeon QH_6_64_20]
MFASVESRSSATPERRSVLSPIQPLTEAPIAPRAPAIAAVSEYNSYDSIAEIRTTSETHYVPTDILDTLKRVNRL